MARGYPDYANPVYSLASKNIDFGSLQTVAMGISSIDGRGRLEWAENWREGIGAWELKKVGDGSYPYVHNLYSIIPPASAGLTYGTQAGGGVSWLRRRGYLNQAIGLGIEFSLSWLTNTAWLQVQLGYDDGVNDYVCSFILELNNGDASIFTGITVPVITTVYNTNELNAFTRFKLAGDFAAGNYLRLIAGMDTFDLSAYPLYVAATSTRGLYTVDIKATAKGASSSTVNLGHVILTTDEP